MADIIWNLVRGVRRTKIS